MATTTIPLTSARAEPRPVVPRTGRCLPLDGARGLAALAVVAFHAGVLPGGFIGVDVFFVLSGFLISSQLADEAFRQATVDVARFWARRFLRIVPPLLLLLTSAAALAALRPPDAVGQTQRGVVAALTGRINYVAATGAELDLVGHVWSIATEVQFYALAPLVFAVVWRAGAGLVAAWAGVLAVTVTAWRAHLWLLDPDWRRGYFAFDTRADGLLLGCCVGLLVAGGLVRPSSRLVWPASAAAAVLALAAATADHVSPVMYLGGFTLVGVAAATVVLQVAVAPGAGLGPVLASRPLVALGRASYGTYLWHIPVQQFASDAFASWSDPQRFALVLPVSLVLGAVSTVLFDRPITELSRRLRPVPA